MLIYTPLIKTIKTHFMELPRKTRWLLAGCIYTLFILLMVLILQKQSSAKLNQADQKLLTQFSHRLNQIEKGNTQQAYQFNEVKLTLNKQTSKLNQQLNDLQLKLANLSKQPADSHLEQTVNSIDSSIQQITSQISQLQTQVNQINSQIKKRTEPHYLPSTVLPFRVTGIDIWNGVAKATVKIRDERNLMAVNDQLAGWTLVNISTEPAIAIFKSKHSQFIKVTL